MEYRTFAPKDPFRPSLHYSLRNIFLGRKILVSHPRQLSKKPFPAFESDSPIPRKNPRVKSPIHSAPHRLADTLSGDEKPQKRDPYLSRQPSPSPPFKPRVLPSPHSFGSARPQSKVPSPSPPSPSGSLVPADTTSDIESSVQYFSSHHSDDEILRDYPDHSAGAPLSPRTIYTLESQQVSRSDSSIGTFQLATKAVADQDSSFVSSGSSAHGSPVVVNDGYLESDPLSSARIPSTSGQRVQRSPSTSLSSMGSIIRADVPIPAPDIAVETRSISCPKTEGDDDHVVVPPVIVPPIPWKYDTLEDLPKSLKLPEHCSSPPKDSLQSSLQFPSQFFVSEKDDISERRSSDSPDCVPPAPSLRTSVEADIVSTPSGCDDNNMFGIPSYALAFMLDTIPRQLYLYFLLFLPSLYFSRVSRIFIDSQLSVYEIDKCILDEAVERHRFNMPLWRPSKWRKRHVDVWSPYDDLEESWQTLTESFMREWNTLNIISGLLLTAIITILQIGNAGEDPLIRHTALLSMICALMSLLFGCMYVIRFGTMQKAYKGAEWAYEADKPRTAIFWNVWVMLAMPATWLGWSILMFIVCIGSFIWRTGTTVDENLAPRTPHQVISARVVVSFILAMGIIYFTLIVATLREYGDAMDTAWTNRISEWVEVFYEHQRMQELRLEPAHDVVQDTRPAPPSPVWQPMIHAPEREYFVDRRPTLVTPRFEFVPRPPPIPMFDPPHHLVHPEYFSGGLFGPRSPGDAGSLISHRRSLTPPPPPPEPQSGPSLHSKSSKGSMFHPSQQPPQSVISPAMNNCPPQSLLTSIPPPVPIVSYTHGSEAGSSRSTSSIHSEHDGAASITIPLIIGQAGSSALDPFFSPLNSPHSLHISIPPPVRIVPHSHEPEVRSSRSTSSIRSNHEGAASITIPPIAARADSSTLDSFFSSLLVGNNERSIGGKMEVIAHQSPPVAGSSRMPQTSAEPLDMPVVSGPQPSRYMHGSELEHKMTSESDNFQSIQYQQEFRPGESSYPDDGQLIGHARGESGIPAERALRHDSKNEDGDQP